MSKKCKICKVKLENKRLKREINNYKRHMYMVKQQKDIALGEMKDAIGLGKDTLPEEVLKYIENIKTVTGQKIFTMMLCFKILLCLIILGVACIALYQLLLTCLYFSLINLVFTVMYFAALGVFIVALSVIPKENVNYYNVTMGMITILSLIITIISLVKDS